MENRLCLVFGHWRFCWGPFRTRPRVVRVREEDYRAEISGSHLGASENTWASVRCTGYKQFSKGQCGHLVTSVLLCPSEMLFLVITLSFTSLHPCLQGHNCASSPLLLWLILMTTVVMATLSPMPAVHTLLSFFFGQWEHTYCRLGNSSGPHTEPTDPCQARRERAHQRESLAGPCLHR